MEVTLRNGVRAIIRPLAKTDGEALAAFYAGIPKEDEFVYCPHPLTREYALRNAAEAGGPTRVTLVLDVAGKIGGYAWHRWEAGAATSTFGICIARAFQGTGAGRQLMKQLLAIPAGPPVISLTVQKRNPKAAELYQSMGFRIVAEQLRKEDGEPEFYMELKRA